jgi:hypothetical protein
MYLQDKHKRHEIRRLYLRNLIFTHKKSTNRDIYRFLNQGNNTFFKNILGHFQIKYELCIQYLKNFTNND